MNSIDEGLKRLILEEWLNGEDPLAMLTVEDWKKEEEDGKLCLWGEAP